MMQDRTNATVKRPEAPAVGDPSLTVEVFSDLICPWCYVGSRRLAEGIARFTVDPGPAGAVPVQVLWHPFELNPDMPTQGRDRHEYRSAKFGSWQRSQQLDAHVTAAGAEDGVLFRHDLMLRTPNTRAGHRLVWWAQQEGRGQQMVDRLFAAYFTQGQDVGDPAVLEELAADAGLARAGAGAAVSGRGPVGQQAEAGVAAGLVRGRDLHIGGVPFTVFGGAYALPPGAQPAEAIAQVLRVLRQDQVTRLTTSVGPDGDAASCDVDGACR